MPTPQRTTSCTSAAPVRRPRADGTLALLASVLALGITGCANEIHVHEELHGKHGDAFVAEGEDLQATLSPASDGWWLGPVIEVDGDFDRVGLRFDAATEVRVEGRLSHDGGTRFGEWRPVQVTWNEEIAHNAHFEAPEGGTHAQLRFQGPVSSDLSFLAVTPILVENIGENRELAVDESQAEGALAADGVVVTRSQWGARARNCGSWHSPNRITVHHTYTPNNDSMSMPARMRQIQAFHIDNRGWCDVGYQFLVGQDGRVYQGRYENRTGAHAAGANRNNVGVSFIGNFTSVLPSQAMFEAGARIIKALADEYDIPLNRTYVKGHRQVGTTATACPGDTFYPRLGDLIELARGTDVDVSQPPPPPADDGEGCRSATLGQDVDHGACVQVAYAGCGLTSCGWYMCQNGSWSCTSPDRCDADDSYENAVCAPAEPDPVEPDPVEPDPVEPDPVTPDPTEPDPVTPDPVEPPVVGACPSGVTCLDSANTRVTGDTRDATRRVFDRYSCDTGIDEGGAEEVYRVVLPEDGFLYASLSGVTGDPDVHILGALDANACEDRGHEDAGAYLAAGEVFVVVDTFVSRWGTELAGRYTLDLAFTGVSDLAAMGVESRAGRRTLQAYDHAWDNGDTDEPLVTLVDYARPATEKRMFVIDLSTGERLFHTHVAHGRRSSDDDNVNLATSFSNTPGSNQSSVGVVKTAESYWGTNGFSMRVDGLEVGFNDNFRSRTKAFYGADFASASYAAQNGVLGRSAGSPAMDPADTMPIIQTIREGTIVVFHGNDANWIANSAYLD